MFVIIGLMTLGIIGLIVTGLFLEYRPADRMKAKSWFKPAMAVNLVFFVSGLALLVFMGAQEVMAQPVETASVKEASTGLGLAIIGIGLPTAFSTIAAGIAVGSIGAASLAALAEKPEIFGRTLVYLGLAEGIAIYGLVMSILLLEKI